jgi:CheY-like chemotaxis protein
MTTARILLVEDDPLSQELIAALLRSRGHDVDVADDGFGALRLAQEGAYDLVFVDYHLPEMDGYALARLMRSLTEGSSGGLTMVAITADQNGLAARRGVDSLFDRVLTKPIEPDELFALVDELLGQESRLESLDAFLAIPKGHHGRKAGQMLWRVRGLGATPSAMVFPEPAQSEREGLEHCFRLTDGDDADCLILLRHAGLARLEALRAQGGAYLRPLFVLDPSLAPMADVYFNAGDGESWSAAVTAIMNFGARRRRLTPEIAGTADFDARLAAYLFVARRSIALCRATDGEMTVPYTAGFSSTAVIEAIKRLAARGLISAKLETTTKDAERRLVLELTPKGICFVSDDHTNARIAG